MDTAVGRSGFSMLLPVWTALVAAAASALTWLLHGQGEDGIRAALRLTAHASVVLFLTAFTASSLARLAPGPVTRRLLVGRRQLGLSFAASHGVHAVAIAALVTGSDFHVDAVAALAGGLGYVFVVLLAATSSDRAVRTLGARAWRRLHLAGSWYLWAIFLVTYARPAAAGDPVAVVASAALVLAALVRLAGRRLRPDGPADLRAGA